MATTLKRIDLLAAGVRDSTGAVVASGKARFYQPGTTTEQTVYQDSAAVTPHTQPVALNAAGQAAVYMLEPVRMVVKDTTETTTYFDAPLLDRHDAVYVTLASINSGVETTLEQVLTDAGTSLGSGFQYKESSGATARGYTGALGERVVSIADFGALGDGSDETTKIQAALNRMAARGGGFVLVPTGTFTISSALLIDTVGVSLIGTGRNSIIKQSSTTANALSVNVGSAIDAKCVIRDLAITASTTSSGTALLVTNGTRIRVQNVQTSLFRKGIDVSGGADSVLRDCLVTSTDSDAAAIAIKLGVRGRAETCIAITAATTGTGFQAAGADGMISDCRSAEFGAAYSLEGLRCSVRGSQAISSGVSGTVGITLLAAACSAEQCYVTGYASGVTVAAATCQLEKVTVDSSTTGITVSAADCVLTRVRSAGTTTGLSIGAVARVTLKDSYFASNTTDIDVNSSATALVEHSNTYATLTDGANLAHAWLKSRRKQFNVTRSSDDTNASLTLTPSVILGDNITYFESLYGTGDQTITIGATATTGLGDGDRMMIVITRASVSNNAVLAWNAQYVIQSGASFPSAASGNVSQVDSTYTASWEFTWRTSDTKWYLMRHSFSKAT